ncbi:MAG TPA: deaminase [Terriglobia bacterium]|nr:deaminase [Terriglobia bacterium]
MLIGLTGRNAAGKGEVAKYLQTKSFYYYSLSDAIRDELRARKLEVSRESLIQVGNELRQRFGPSILADRIVELTRPDRNYIIDSIRNPAEVATLRKACREFKLIRVDAPLQTRFERTVARRRENDPITFEAFVALETREASGDPMSQNLDEVEKLADEILVNDSSLEELRPKIDVMVSRLLTTTQRPGWDQYFMDIARVVASRSNCMKRKVAAVIVLDKRIISTGYNGTPRGTKNCNEGGCPRCNNLATSGTGLDECLCSHGEENAIVQASYHGVSLKDATIYSTFAPCLMCAKMIINSGIREVVYNLDYPLNDSAFRLFNQARVNVRQLRLQ